MALEQRMGELREHFGPAPEVDVNILECRVGLLCPPRA